MKTLKIYLAALMLLTTHTFAQESNETVYYFAVGWEHLPQNEKAKLNMQPVVSNVVRINCGDYSVPSTSVTNQLRDYYQAYHAKQRGFMNINRTIAWGPYPSWEEAENERRKKIADYNRDWNPLILQHFTYLCE